MNKNQQEQYEKDIESVIRFLKVTDPENATREHAIEMLGNMESLAHLVAHDVVNRENSKSSKSEPTFKILIFTEGTVLMHGSAVDKTREDIVKESHEFGIQMEDANLSLEDKINYGIDKGGIHDYLTYVPVKNAVDKIRAWKNQGASIYYLTSRRVKTEIDAIHDVLRKYKFPDSDNLLYRNQGENYKDVAEKLLPNVIVEDDCESIGGTNEMTYTHLSPEIKTQIISIPVKEFSGIDDLPDNISDLAK